MARPSRIDLSDGSRIAVLGGGPAGSFFTYFLLEIANRVGLNVQVDIYEPKDFSQSGPVGCNMCGGIVHESLVQLLATEGINLPPTVVQRGIDSHVLHMGVGSVRIETPLHEKRIGALHRGAGPRGVKERKWDSFDGHLLSLAAEKGARVVRGRASDVAREKGGLRVTTRSGLSERYDLVAVAVGVNTANLRFSILEEFGYIPPETVKTNVREYYMGQEAVESYMGSSVHVFLLNIPRLEFAAFIPKGDYLTMCLVGDEIDRELLRSLLTKPEVQRCFPSDLCLEQPDCQCSPRISVKGAKQPFADRLIFLGDCGVTRFYKDGIGSAYRVAKVAATTSVFHGISADSFRRHYWPVCRALNTDNTVAKFIFGVVRQIQRRSFARQAVVRMVSREQKGTPGGQRMSTMMWDMYTGGAPYREILLGGFHPGFWAPFAKDCILSAIGVQ